MSDTSVPPEPEDLAAEYALGVLDAEAHRAAEARALADPSFAAETLAWSERLAPLLDEIAPAQPGSGLWARIAARLDEEATPAAVTDLSTRRSTQLEKAALARSRSVWRGTAFAAMAASLACILALSAVLFRPVAPRPPLMVARLEAQSGASGLMAAYDPARRFMLVSLPVGTAPTGRAPELWLIDASGKPVALGVVKSGDVATMPVPAGIAARMKANVVLALSLEPLGGSPTGLPTGPVVAKGALLPA